MSKVQKPTSAISSVSVSDGVALLRDGTCVLEPRRGIEHWTLDVGLWTLNHSPMTEPEHETADDAEPRPLREGEDYYIENGLMVFTAAFLNNRGYCCESGCRHCPYGFVKEERES